MRGQEQNVGAGSSDASQKRVWNKVRGHGKERQGKDQQEGPGIREVRASNVLALQIQLKEPVTTTQPHNTLQVALFLLTAVSLFPLQFIPYIFNFLAFNKSRRKKNT